MDANVVSIDSVADWLAFAKSAVVLTGAGISTESGIPDFRSPRGGEALAGFDKLGPGTSGVPAFEKQKKPGNCLPGFD
jgi:hypothetical protein